jgi:DNA repair photolyase
MAKDEPQTIPEGLGPLEGRCDDVWDLNLFRECGCDCLTCSRDSKVSPDKAAPQASFYDYTRSRNMRGTPDGLGLNRRLPQQLRTWIHSLGDHRPSFITLGYGTEPLPGFPEAEEVLDQCLRVLQGASMGVSLRTRRLVPARILDTLAEFGPLARVTLPLPTLSDAELKIWEPGTALANQRLWNAQQLRLRRVEVTLSIQPLIPYVNDDRAHLAPLVGAAADVGVRRLTAEFMRLTPSVRARLEAQSPVSTQLIFGAYVRRELDHRQDWSLPNLKRRRTVYRLLTNLANKRRLRFSLCRCADPLLGQQTCALWPGDAPAPAEKTTPITTPITTPKTTPEPTRRSRARTHRRPMRSASQVGFSEFFDSKQ